MVVLALVVVQLINHQDSIVRVGLASLDSLTFTFVATSTILEEGQIIPIIPNTRPALHFACQIPLDLLTFRVEVKRLDLQPTAIAYHLSWHS